MAAGDANFLVRVALDLSQPVTQLSQLENRLRQTFANASQQAIQAANTPIGAARGIGAINAQAQTSIQQQVASGSITPEGGVRLQQIAAGLEAEQLRALSQMSGVTQSLAQLEGAAKQGSRTWLQGGTVLGQNINQAAAAVAEMRAAVITLGKKIALPAFSLPPGETSKITGVGAAAARQAYEKQQPQYIQAKVDQAYAKHLTAFETASSEEIKGMRAAAAGAERVAKIQVELAAALETLAPEVVQDAALLKQASLKFNAAVESLLISPQFKGAQDARASLARSNAISQGQTSTALAGDAGYLAAKAEVALEKTTTGLYVARDQQGRIARDAAAIELRKIAIDRALGVITDQEARDKAIKLGVENKLLAAEVGLAAAQDNRVAVANANLAVENAINKAETAAFVATDERVAVARETMAVENAIASAGTQLALLRNELVQQLKTGVATGSAATTIERQITLVQNELLQALKLRLKTEKTVAAANESEALYENAEFRDANLKRRANTSAIKNEEDIALLAQRSQEQQALVQARLNAARTANQLAAEQGEVTFWQRLYAQAANSTSAVRSGARAPVLAQNAPGFGATIGGNIFRSAGFLASGAVLFGAIGAIKTAIDESADLEKSFNIIKSQFEGLGKGDQAAGFIKQLKEISRETGQTTADVAKVGFQFVGAFQDINRATQETRSASELSRITDLPVSEITDSLTAITQSYKGTGVTIREVGDVAIGLQEKFGVLARETITFAADLAPVAQAAGFSATQLEVLGGVLQKYSGRSGSSLAEGFGRILPEIQSNALQLVQFSRNTPGLADQTDALVKNLGSGNISGVIDTLGKSYEKLTDSQKGYLEALLGGRREAQYIIPLLRNYSEYLDTVGHSSEFAGKQTEYFNNLQTSLSQTFAKLSANLRLIGVGLVQSGIGDFIKILLSGLTSIITPLGKVLELFTDLNDLTHGAVSRIIAMAAAIALLSKALQSLAQAEILKVFGTLFAGRAVGGGLGNFALQGIPTVGPNLPLSAAPGTLATAGAAASRTGAIRTLGSGALAAVGGVPGVIAIGGIVAYTYMDSFSKGFKKAAADRAQKIAGDDGVISADEFKQLGKLSTQRTGLERFFNFGARDDSYYRRFIGNVPILGNFVGAGTAQRNAALQLQNDNFSGRYSEILQGLKDQNLLAPTKGQEDQDKFIASVKAGQYDLNSVQDFLDKQAAVNPAIKSFLDAFQTRDEKLAEGAQKEQQIADNVAAAKSSFESGQIALSDYIAVLQQEVNDLQALQDSGLTDADKAAKLAADRAEIIKALTDSYQNEFSRNKRLRDLAGTGSAKADLTALQAEYEHLKETPGVNPGLIADVRLQIFQAVRDTIDEDISNANTAGEKARLRLQGINVDQIVPGLRLEELKFQITQGNTAFQQFLAQAQLTGVDVDNKLLEQIASFMIATNAGFVEAFKTILQHRIDTLKAAINLPNAIGVAQISGIAELENLQKLINDFDKAGQPGADIAASAGTYHPEGKTEDTAGENEAEALAKRIKAARDKYEEAKVGKDAVKLAQLHQQQAARAATEAKDEAEKIDAQTDSLKADRELRDAIVAVYDAYTDSLISAAKRGNDFIKAAELAVQKAQLALDVAKDSGNQADILSAQQQLDEAMEDLRLAQIKQIDDAFNAQNELATAIAEAAGDSVQAAKLAAESARHAYESAVAEHGTSSNEAVRAEAASVRAAASVRDAQLAEDQDNIQFALDMEEITKDQALEQFKALLQLPGLTLEQTRALRRKIKELQDSTSSDLQYDLPTDIRLPTLYQVARYNTGYADNRVVVINTYVGNNVDAGNLVNQISNQVNSPPRLGTSIPVY